MKVGGGLLLDFFNQIEGVGAQKKRRLYGCEVCGQSTL